MRLGRVVETWVTERVAEAGQGNLVEEFLGLIQELACDLTGLGLVKQQVLREIDEILFQCA